LPRFRVPLEYREALQRLASLPDDVYGRLLEQVAREPLSTNVAGLKSKIEDGRQSAGWPDADPLVEALLNIHALRKSWRATDTEIAADLAEADELGLEEPEEKRRFIERLANLLRARAVDGLAHAIDVGYEYGQIFSESRVLTDIRPLFLKQPVSRPDGVVIAHTLRIDYLDGRENRTAYFALDEDDLLRLQDNIRRAFDKSAALTELIKGTEVPLFDLKEEE
jgi:hypothetical protein